MENKSIFKGASPKGKSKIIVKSKDPVNKNKREHKDFDFDKVGIAQEEKIEIEFRISRRIFARDFVAIKTSFEEWASNWN
jgi:hypothetical protein